MKLIRAALITCVALLIGVTSGCAQLGKVTGGGWMPSANEQLGGKANFGFNADSCDAYEFPEDSGEYHGIKGRFNYHDMNAGVKMNGEVVAVLDCITILGRDASDPVECKKCPHGYLMQVEYRSTNPTNRGEGTAYACVYDNGEGVNAKYSDGGKVWISDGPFTGYENKNFIQGNIQGHECKEKD